MGLSTSMFTYDHTRVHRILYTVSRRVLGALEFCLISSRGSLSSGLRTSSHPLKKHNNLPPLTSGARGVLCQGFSAGGRQARRGHPVSSHKTLKKAVLASFFACEFQAGDKWISSLFLILCVNHGKKGVFLPSCKEMPKDEFSRLYLMENMSWRSLGAVFAGGSYLAKRKKKLVF